MKFLLGSILLIGSICGVAISALGSLTFSSDVIALSGENLSLGVGLFSFFVLLSSLYLMFLSG